MNNTKHTPGPWYIGHDSGQYYVGAENNPVAWGIEGNEKGLANANLIAAAPDMLEALILADNHIRKTPTAYRGQHEYIATEILQPIEQAIAKAKGE